MKRTPAGREQKFVSGLIIFSRVEAEVAAWRRQKSTRSRCAMGGINGGIPRSLASPAAPAPACPGDFLGGNADPVNVEEITVLQKPFIWNCFFQSHEKSRLTARPNL